MANSQWPMARKYEKSLFQYTPCGAKPYNCQLCDILGNVVDTGSKSLLRGVSAIVVGGCTILP